jgi:hypothetical protein
LISSQFHDLLSDHAGAFTAKDLSSAFERVLRISR